MLDDHKFELGGLSLSHSRVSSREDVDMSGEKAAGSRRRRRAASRISTTSKTAPTPPAATAAIVVTGRLVLSDTSASELSRAYSLVDWQ